jgi:predicted nucleotidyltransferase
MQRWLGDSYCKLYSRFGRDVFTASEAAGVLDFESPKLHVAFSKLHSAGALILFTRSRPRRYRLLDPRSLALEWSGAVERVEFRHEEYTQLIFDVLRAVRSRLSLVSFCVYGSVARGEAEATSDLDVLLVSNDFGGSLASRLDFLSFVDEKTSEEVGFLRRNGRETAASFMPLRKNEAEGGPVLFLDLAAHAKILFDEGGFLRGVLTRLRGRLDLAGAKRVETGKGWYWDLKPDFVPGQEVVV